MFRRDRATQQALDRLRMDRDAAYDDADVATRDAEDARDELAKVVADAEIKIELLRQQIASLVDPDTVTVRGIVRSIDVEQEDDYVVLRTVIQTPAGHEIDLRRVTPGAVPIVGRTFVLEINPRPLDPRLDRSNT